MGIWLCGGGKLAGTLLPKINELVIKSYPVFASAGVPVVHGGFTHPFAVGERTAFANGVALARFSRRREAEDAVQHTV